MKILMLSSGGDAPGMNRFIYDIYAKFKDDVYFALAGYTGLVNGEIFPLKDVIEKSKRNLAGTVIKSSRCPEFKEAKVFKMGLLNAKLFDVVIILGGNGSEKGAKQLYENGVNTIFVPATIDNDVDDSVYSIGFHTAVKEGVYAVENTMPSIEAFSKTCLFEVMGRKNAAIAKAVAEKVDADMVVCSENDLDYEKIKNVILKNKIANQSTSIIVRENIKSIKEIAENINASIGMDMVLTHVVGRTQRGGKPTAEELDMASKFAKETIFCIKKGVLGVRVLVDENYKIYVDEFKG